MKTSSSLQESSRKARPRFIGIVGDVHAQAPALETALKRLAQRHAPDRIVCVGDIVDGDGSVDACCDLLRLYDVLTVRGNHDRWALSHQMRSGPHATAMPTLALRTRQFLRALGAAHVLPVTGGTLVVAHGVPGDDMRAWPRRPDPRFVDLIRNHELIPDDCVAVVSGHSHRRGSARVAGLTFVSAGALVSTCVPGYTLLDTLKQTVVFHRL